MQFDDFGDGSSVVVTDNYDGSGADEGRVVGFVEE